MEALRPLDYGPRWPARLGLGLAAFAFFLFAAHALRMGDMGGVAAWLCMVGMLLSRRAWVRFAVMAALVYGAFLWADVGTRLVSMRLAMGADWVRLAVIMGSALSAPLAALALLLSRSAERRFSLAPEGAVAKGAVFALSCGLLLLTRSQTPMPVLLADRFFPGWGLVEILLLGVYAAWVLGKLLPPKDSPEWRGWLWAVFSRVFFVQLFLGLLGVDEMLMTGRLHLPVPALILGGPLFRGSGFFMPILFGVTVLLVGPAWCSYLCYIGAWDNGMSRMAKGGPKYAELPGWSSALRWGLLLLTIGLALGLRWAGVSGGAAVWIAAVFGVGGVAVMATLSRASGTMVHCTVYCPMGLVSNLSGKISPWRMRIGKDCTHCGRCTRACRYAALSPGDLERGRPGLRCTLCGDCVSACKTSCLQYSFLTFKGERARVVFLTLVVALHACFLGVARM